MMKQTGGGDKYVYREADDVFSYNSRYKYGEGDGIIDVGSGSITDSYSEIILNDDGTFTWTSHRTFRFFEIKIDRKTRKEYVDSVENKAEVYPSYLFFASDDFNEDKEFKSEYCEKGTWKKNEDGLELTEKGYSLKIGTAYAEAERNDAKPSFYLLKTDKDNKEYLIESDDDPDDPESIKYYRQ